MTEEYSTTILNKLPEKKKDPGGLTNICSIEMRHFHQAQWPAQHFNTPTPTPTLMQLQLADSSVRYSTCIGQDIPVNIRDFFIPVDMVRDQENDKEMLILGWLFLSTAEAHIDVGAGVIWFHINGNEEKFDFHTKREQCSMIKINSMGRMRKNIKQVEVTPPKKHQHHDGIPKKRKPYNKEQANNWEAGAMG